MSSGEAKRTILWATWTLNLIVDGVYVLLCWITADNLSRASGNLHIENGWKDVSQSAKAFVSNNIWRAPIAACALGGLMVVLFNLLSCLVLVRRSIARTGPGFGYGFVVAWAFVMSFFTLMCGLILEGFKDVVSSELEKTENWTALATGAFQACYGFSYVVSGLFMLFFLIMLVFQGAVTKELGIYDAMAQGKRLAEMNALASGGAAVHMNPLAAGPI
ncbi:MAG: hypothetical protein J3K34DRAFT_441378 [Monoraphidium minutum]|nr:MAG: hypothetical protein J3K34DRAFT_441378 [Monoraphidium minutum]